MPATFTPEQISQILEEFFKVVGTRQYIGARYVPIFGRKDEESIEWDNTGEYEPLTIVLYQGNSYTSRQFVPVGVEITNQEFWAITGNYNAQVEQYRRETAAAKATADAAQADIDTLLPKDDFSATNTVKKYIDTVKATADGARADIDTLLPKADFSATNTVKNYIDTEILRSKKPFVFNTVAEMLNYSLLYEGAICHTNGFHESNDNGGAWYVIDGAGTPNGMDIIACENNLNAHLILTASMNPKQFGAYGNGVNDDTEAIQRAMDKNIGTIVFTEGIYNISNTIGTNGNVDMCSSAFIKTVTQLEYAVKTNFYVDIQTESVDTPRNQTIHMNIDCNNITEIGIGVNRINNSKISAQVLNFTKTGMYCRYSDTRAGACAENVLSVNARNDRQAISDCEALYLNISDTVVDTVFAKDIQIGLHVATSNAVVNIVHPWLYNFAELYQDSKCVVLDVNAGITVTQIYHDTMRYGIYCEGGNYGSIKLYRYLHATERIPAAQSTSVYEPFNFYNNGSRNSIFAIDQMNNESEPLYANVCKQFGYMTTSIKQTPNRSLNYQLKDDLNNAPIGTFIAQYAESRNFPSGVTTDAKVTTIGDGYKFNQFLTVGNSIEYIYVRTISKDSATNYSTSSWRKLNPQF